ncbi:Neuronal acetylcholine receptor subunit alpha-7 [Toxocara canis]|uniref:Neuronal acetylcholine receptor subunit alpha-7 n=1 Tax=Toxocara canis TaxID=6265 RepID=A0A0B2UPW9_TOXCA|nr:Neuronal acetylcholine receptor subunit alpha-7 [Toxocara canis]
MISKTQKCGDSKMNRRHCAYGRHALDEQQFAQLLSEIRVLSAKVLKEEVMHDLRAEWKFVAMVIDRVCFISFSLFLIICTSVIVWRAPHLIA